MAASRVQIFRGDELLGVTDRLAMFDARGVDQVKRGEPDRCSFWTPMSLTPGERYRLIVSPGLELTVRVQACPDPMAVFPVRATAEVVEVRANGLIEEARRILVDEYGCHTVILYGSRARGDSTDASDVDIAGFGAAASTRDTRKLGSVFLDAFVCTEAELEADATPESLKFLNSVLLVDPRGAGARFLHRVGRLHARGPEPLPASERRMIRAWIEKTVARIARGDLEAHYRRHWLLFDMIENDHKLRGQWFLGSKDAFARLERDRPDLHAAFAEALAPNAALDAIERLARMVLDGAGD
jgi:hypothetical protein